MPSPELAKAQLQQSIFVVAMGISGIAIASLFAIFFDVYDPRYHDQVRIPIAVFALCFLALISLSALPWLQSHKRPYSVLPVRKPKAA